MRAANEPVTHGQKAAVRDREAVDPDDIERRLYCRRALQREALSCESCAVEDPISAEEQRQDMHGLAAILELARIGHALRNRDENKKP